MVDTSSVVGRSTEVSHVAGLPGKHGCAPGVRTSFEGGRPMVEVAGLVDRTKVTEVSGILRGLVARSSVELVVDLGAAWNAALLLPVLSRVRAAANDRGGELVLRGIVVPEFLAALDTASLDEVFLVWAAVHGEATRRHVPSPRTAP